LAQGPIAGVPSAARGGGFHDVYAAVDLGTNNCRLLIARPSHEGFRVVDAFSRIIRLGEGLVGSGTLSEPAMARALEALRICAGKVRRRRVTRLRAVATEACRRAGNRRAFQERVERETGLQLEVIGVEEEVELALLGCAPLLSPDVPEALIFDIGGGSTQLAWLSAGGAEAAPGRLGGRELKALASLPLGVVTLAERYGSAVTEAAGFDAIVAEVVQALAPFRRQVALDDALAAGRVQMLGTSGTVTTLVGVHLGLARYDRARVDGAFIDIGTVRRVTRDLLALPLAERAANPCIGEERADLVIAGCAVLEAICRCWPVARLRVADRGLREGILLSLIRPASEPHLRGLVVPS
jgi:exopolyphosphatase/guanosine-5'-triphosphate,3'-diphosphate pyrophosphatase